MRKQKLTWGLSVSLLLLVALLGLGLVLGNSVKAQTVSPTEPAPTPTVPSWNRPNFHLYLVDEKKAPVAEVRVQLIDLAFVGGKTEAFPLVEGVTDSAGRVSFDVMPYPLNKIYLLRLSEADGAPILPYDPNPQVPKPGLSIGQADPVTRYLVPIDLTLGSVVYVQKYTIKPLVPQANPRPTATLAPDQPTPVSQLPAHRAIGRLAGEVESFTYYPPHGSGDLATGGNAPGTVTGSPAPLVIPGVIAIATTTASSSVATTTARGTANSPVQTSVKPTPTIECRGCGTISTLSPKADTGSNSVAATVDNRNGGGRATPTALPPGVLTQRAEVTARLPTAASSSANTAFTPPSVPASVPSHVPTTLASGTEITISNTISVVAGQGRETALVTSEGNTVSNFTSAATSSSPVLPTPQASTFTPSTLEVVPGISSPSVPGQSTSNSEGASKPNQAGANNNSWLGLLVGITLVSLFALGGVVSYFVIGKERLSETARLLLSKFEKGNGKK